MQLPNPGKTLLLVLLMCSKASFAQLKVESIKFNKQITGFSFAADMDGMLVYLPQGKADLDRAHGAEFSLRVHENEDAEGVKRYLNFMKDYEIKHGGTLTDVKEKDTMVNNLTVHIITMREQFKGIQTRAHHFYASITKGHDSVIFLSSDLDHDKYFNKLVKTFYSIQL